MPSFTVSRRALVVTLVLAVLLVVGHVLLWNREAQEFESRYAAWAAEETTKGFKVEGQRRVTGFPFSVALEIADFAYDRSDVARIAAPQVTLSFRPWTPHRFTAWAEQGVQFTFPRADTVLAVKNVKLTLARPFFAPRSTRNNGLFVTLGLTGITLDERQKMALGNLVQEVSFRARVKGAPPNPEDRGELEAWRRDGGVVEFDRLGLVWGSLNIGGKGTLALDKDFQPQASFSATVFGHEQAVDVLRDQGQIKPLVASLIKAALKMLEEDEEKKSGTPTQTIRVPITVQDNALSVAGVNLISWPPVPWP